MGRVVFPFKKILVAGLVLHPEDVFLNLELVRNPGHHMALGKERGLFEIGGLDALALRDRLWFLACVNFS